MSSLATDTIYGTLLEFLADLDGRRVGYTLASARPQAVMVQVAVPGERWEIEFLTDGTVEVERFASDGTIADATALDVLRRRLDAEDTAD